uniref:WW domain binding protein 1 n=1 Tax=Latimeria chalumnae TaxID=7897 RepID=H3B3X5_LATCH
VPYYLFQGKEYCFGVNSEPYRCETGYCCGETECCTYYYELWLSCCCAYRHRRVKMRLQQEQRQREISLMAYQGAASTFAPPPPLNLRFWTNCKLPAYEEVAGHPPTPPPPYSEVQQEDFLNLVDLVNTGPILEPAVAMPTSRDEESLQHAAGPDWLPSQEEGEPNGWESHICAQGSDSCTFSSSDRLDDDGVEGAELHAVDASAPWNKDLGPTASNGAEVHQEDTSRRRHITGDSGIEVCICHVNDGHYLEEDEEGCVYGSTGSRCCDPETDRERTAKQLEFYPTQVDLTPEVTYDGACV